jgi:integrase
VASIHKIKGASKNWLCSIKLGSGKRTFRSSGLPATEANRPAAQSLCEQWQRMEDGLAGTDQDQTRLQFENSREVAESFITASRKLTRGEFTESDARAMLDSILVAGRENPISNETTREVFENWLKGKTLSKSGRTADRYKTVVKLFLKQIGAKADRPLATLTVRDVEAFRDARLKNRLSNRTTALDLKIIRGVLEGARRQGLILRNPGQGCELPRAGGSERDTFTVEEIQALSNAVPGEWKTALLFGYYLGARLEDAVSMNWEQIDLGEITLRYKQRKTGRVVTVPLHPDLEAHLLKIAGDDPRGNLTPELAAKAGKGDGNLSKQFGRLMAKAGVDRSNSQPEGRRAFSRKSFHSLRHSFASHLANAGVADEVRMRLTGHSSGEVHQRYTHLEIGPLRHAIETLPSVLRRASPAPKGK